MSDANATLSTSPSELLKTPLHKLHLELGARMVPFAGYDMPVQYPSGLMSEHKQCRNSAALFDVSHMGQLRLLGGDAAAALESLVPVDVIDLAVGKQRYGFFTNHAGGLLDDLMITRREDDIFVVVNASCKVADTEHMIRHIGGRCQVQSLPDLALLALQGPMAAQALSRLNAQAATLTFMTGIPLKLAGCDCFVTRSGYTGEDGFEISVPAHQAEGLARALLEQTEVKPAGLGARDTLRLEAGLCLYGHDIHTETTPVEAALTWAIQKVRRSGGARAGGFPGADVIQAELLNGAQRKRIGLVGQERAPVREGARLFDSKGQFIGVVTSGTLAPTVNQAIAMAYLPTAQAVVGQTVWAEVRGKKLPMTITTMPFTANRYYRG